MRKIILASASPARLALLCQAGLAPQVVISGFDEGTITSTSTSELAGLLAAAKARAVIADFHDALVIGCDSLLEFDDEALGKPESAAEAARWWKARSNRSGTLYTGHCVIDTRTDREARAVVGTTVRFGSPTEDEIAAYLNTGEPLKVAGAFTIYGRGAWFVDAIEGDASNVLGLSLSTLRSLLADLGVEVTDLWAG